MVQGDFWFMVNGSGFRVNVTPLMTEELKEQKWRKR